MLTKFGGLDLDACAFRGGAPDLGGGGICTLPCLTDAGIAHCRDGGGEPVALPAQGSDLARELAMLSPQLGDGRRPGLPRRLRAAVLLQGVRQAGRERLPGEPRLCRRGLPGFDGRDRHLLVRQPAGRFDRPLGELGLGQPGLRLPLGILRLPFRRGDPGAELRPAPAPRPLPANSARSTAVARPKGPFPRTVPPCSIGRVAAVSRCRSRLGGKRLAMAPADSDLVDLTIVGAGPAGLYAAFYAGLRALRVRVLEALPFAGGQVAALYPEKAIFDVGGFPRVQGAELVARLEEQARSARPEMHLQERVLRLERGGDGFTLTTAQNAYRSRAVLLTTGVGSFAPKPLGTPAVDAWAGRGVRHTVRQAAEFADRDCLVVGGGDAALDWAWEMAEAGARVTLLHRRDQFRAAEASLTRAQAAGVRIRRSTVLEALHGDGDEPGEPRPRRATVRELRTGAVEEVPCSAVVLALGFAADLTQLRDWGLPLDGRGLIVTPDTMAVAPGIYAAGDAAAYPGKLKLIATAFAEAALAVSACKQALDPAARLQAGHSSDRGSTVAGA